MQSENIYIDCRHCENQQFPNLLGFFGNYLLSAGVGWVGGGGLDGGVCGCGGVGLHVGNPRERKKRGIRLLVAAISGRR